MRFVLLAAFVVLSTLACSGPTVGASTSIRVMGAQSLEKTFRALGADFEKANPGTRVELSFAGSQVLVAQLQEGAAADVIATADAKTMERLMAAHLVDAPRIFARNRLVVAVPAANPAKVAAPADLGRPGVKVVLASEAVPAGSYARQALRTLGVLDAVEHNVVSNEDNVASVLTKVTLGEAEAGVVYATDVAGSGGKALAIPFADLVDVDVRYPIAKVRPWSGETAERFVAFVLGPPGQERLRSAGFLAP